MLSTDGEAFFIRHVSGGPIRIGYSVDADYFVETMNLNSRDLGYRVLAAIPGGRAATRDLLPLQPSASTARGSCPSPSCSPTSTRSSGLGTLSTSSG
jgi:hypothetical protein